jgi:YHS domain-containing protein
MRLKLSSPPSVRHSYRWFKLCFTLLLTTISTPVLAAGDINVVSSNGLAIHGYDPVAYFVSGEPQEGIAAYSYEFEGTKWAFVNEENKQAFIANPDAYNPQYGGHCAYAASKNSIANTDPYAWTIHDGKLYLNYSKGVRTLWNLSRDSNIVKVDGYWPELARTIK